MKISQIRPKSPNNLSHSNSFKEVYVNTCIFLFRELPLSRQGLIECLVEVVHWKPCRGIGEAQNEKEIGVKRMRRVGKVMW